MSHCSKYSQLGTSFHFKNNNDYESFNAKSMCHQQVALLLKWFYPQFKDMPSDC